MRAMRVRAQLTRNVLSPFVAHRSSLVTTYSRAATLVRSVGFTAQRRMLHSTTHALKATAPTYPAESTQVPDFSKYKRAKGDPSGGRAFTYVMLGTTGFVAAAGAKNAVAALLTQLAPSADVLALAKVELDLTAIPEGKNVTIKWRGKPYVVPMCA